jgi:hypothetical protein
MRIAASNVAARQRGEMRCAMAGFRYRLVMQCESSAN